MLRAKAVGLKLAGKYLLATPDILPKSIFSQSLIYVFSQDAEGDVLGLVVNKPANDARVADLLDSLDLTDKTPNKRLSASPIYLGGPVSTSQVNIVHELHKDWSGDYDTGTQRIAVTARKGLLASMCEGEGPQKYIITAGVAGWAPEQLEMEIGNNSWLVTEADPEIIFACEAGKRADLAARQIGFPLELLGGTAGSG